MPETDPCAAARAALEAAAAAKDDAAKRLAAGARDADGLRILEQEWGEADSNYLDALSAFNACMQAHAQTAPPTETLPEPPQLTLGVPEDPTYVPEPPAATPAARAPEDGPKSPSSPGEPPVETGFPGLGQPSVLQGGPNAPPTWAGGVRPGPRAGSKAGAGPDPCPDLKKAAQAALDDVQVIAKRLAAGGLDPDSEAVLRQEETDAAARYQAALKAHSECVEKARTSTSGPPVDQPGPRGRRNTAVVGVITGAVLVAVVVTIAVVSHQPKPGAGGTAGSPAGPLTATGNFIADGNACQGPLTLRADWTFGGAKPGDKVVIALTGDGVPGSATAAVGSDGSVHLSFPIPPAKANTQVTYTGTVQSVGGRQPPAGYGWSKNAIVRCTVLGSG